MTESTSRNRIHRRLSKRPEMESELLRWSRTALLRQRGVAEVRIFGGNCFLANGNMIGGVTGKGELVVRVGPDGYNDALADRHTRPMNLTGRPMRGFVYVDLGGRDTEAKVRGWLMRGLAYARSLPPKKK